jgi:hypothetical protein
MGILAELLRQHPYIALGILLIQSLATWFMNNKATMIVSAIPMPTKNSSPGEIWWFKFFNNLVGNKLRADLPSLEASPNFVDAVNNKLAEVGRPPIPDAVLLPPPTTEKDKP